MKKKLHYHVSFDIDMTYNDDEDVSMHPNEIKSNIKFWMEGQFRDYFSKFKIKNLKCHKYNEKCYNKIH